MTTYILKGVVKYCTSGFAYLEESRRNELMGGAA